MDAAHMTFTILEAHQDNPYFRSPISSTAQHVLDLGTGTAVWANDVADRFPNCEYGFFLPPKLSSPY